MVCTVTQTAVSYSSYLTNYYTRGAQEFERRGVWVGSGTELLVGEPEFSLVTGRVAEAIMKGFGPDGAKWVRNAGQDRSGYDIVIDVPKRISIWIGLAPTDELRAEREEHVRKTVTDVVIPMLSDLVVARRGAGGSRFEPALTTWMLFEHHSSRHSECQTHFHILWPAVIVAPSDGVTLAGSARLFYEAQRAIDDAFRAELARRLEPFRHELEEIPESLCEAMSTSRRRLLEFAGADSTAEARQVAALAVRPAKDYATAPEKVRARWRELAKEHGYEPTQDHVPELEPEVELSCDKASPLRSEEAVRAETAAELAERLERELEDVGFPDLSPEERLRFQSPPPPRHPSLLLEERYERELEDVGFPDLSPEDRTEFTSRSPNDTTQRTPDPSRIQRFGESVGCRLALAREAIAQNLTTRLVRAYSFNALARGVRNMRDPLQPVQWWEENDSVSQMFGRIFSAESVIGNLMLKPLVESAYRTLYESFSPDTFARNLTLQPLREAAKEAISPAALWHNLLLKPLWTGTSAQELSRNERRKRDLDAKHAALEKESELDEQLRRERYQEHQQRQRERGAHGI